MRDNKKLCPCITLGRFKCSLHSWPLVVSGQGRAGKASWRKWVLGPDEHSKRNGESSVSEGFWRHKSGWQPGRSPRGISSAQARPAFTAFHTPAFLAFPSFSQGAGFLRLQQTGPGLQPQLYPEQPVILGNSPGLHLGLTHLSLE